MILPLKDLAASLAPHRGSGRSAWVRRHPQNIR